MPDNLLAVDPADDDHVARVTGVAAAAILARCAAARAARGAPADQAAPLLTAAALRPTPPVPAWDWAAFRNARDDAFVVAAHVRLLGRPPHAPELARRLAALAAGSSRAVLLARIALSAEGRRAPPARVTGLRLRGLVALARFGDRALRDPLVGEAMGAVAMRLRPAARLARAGLRRVRAMVRRGRERPPGDPA